MSLDVESEDLSGSSLRLIGTLGDLDTARFATASGLDLCLDDDHRGTDCGSGFFGFRGGGRRNATQHRNPMGLEDVSGLVLVQIHACLPAHLRWYRPDPWRRTRSGCAAGQTIRSLSVTIDVGAGEAALIPLGGCCWLPASARLTNDEVRCEALVRGGWRTEVEDHGNGSVSHSLNRLPGHGQRGPAALRLRRAIEGHDGDVIRAAQAGFTDCFQGASAQLIRGREDRVWPSRPVQEPYRGFVPALAAEAGADNWTGRQIMRLESIAPSSFARVWNRLARFTHDQRDRLMTVNGDEMIDKCPGTLPRVWSHSGRPGNVMARKPAGGSPDQLLHALCRGTRQRTRAEEDRQ